MTTLNKYSGDLKGRLLDLYNTLGPQGWLGYGDQSRIENLNDPSDYADAVLWSKSDSVQEEPLEHDLCTPSQDLLHPSGTPVFRTADPTDDYFFNRLANSPKVATFVDWCRYERHRL